MSEAGGRVRRGERTGSRDRAKKKWEMKKKNPVSLMFFLLDYIGQSSLDTFFIKIYVASFFVSSGSKVSSFGGRQQWRVAHFLRNQIDIAMPMMLQSWFNEVNNVLGMTVDFHFYHLIQLQCTMCITELRKSFSELFFLEYPEGSSSICSSRRYRQCFCYLETSIDLLTFDINKNHRKRMKQCITNWSRCCECRWREEKFILSIVRVFNLFFPILILTRDDLRAVAEKASKTWIEQKTRILFLLSECFA